EEAKKVKEWKNRSTATRREWFYPLLPLCPSLPLPPLLLVGRGRNARRLPNRFVIGFIFVQNAKPLRHFPARLQFVEFGRANPGLRVRLRIVDGDLQFQGVVIQSAVAFRQVRLLAAWISVGVGPHLVI